MNDLNIKQNIPESLSLLKLQRYKYNIISIIATFNFIISVIIPIILSFIGLVPMQNNFVQYINYLGLICTFFSLWLDFKLKKLKEDASQIQYLFDINLFGMRQNPLISKLSLNELLVAANRSKIQKLQGVENWYSIGDNLNKIDAIYSCQKQNIRWDKRLRKKYLSAIVVVCILAILGIISVAILVNLPFNTLWSYIFLLVPIISYCATFIFSSISNIKEQDNLLNLFQKYNNTKKLTLKKLESLEEKIYYYRKELVKIPNWFFLIFKSSMQKDADSYSKFESDTFFKSDKKL